MRTYLNNTGAARVVSYASTDGVVELTVDTGARITFNEAEPNGPDIDTACRNAGFTRV